MEQTQNIPGSDTYWKKLNLLSTRLFRLRGKDQFLLLKACFIIILFRVSLKLIATDKLYAMLNTFLRTPFRKCSEYSQYTSRVIWAVERSGNYLLRKKCLAQALAVHVLLNNKKIVNQLHIGIAIANASPYAHAWIQADDRVLTGGDESIKYYFTIALYQPGPSREKILKFR